VNIFELFVVQPIFNLLLFIYSVLPGADFGIAIIIFTIIIRFALYPLVVRQLHQVKAMRKLQPELKRIKAASKGNRQAESMQMLELYKQHGVKPFRSILMLLIQLPIFIALFQVIQIFTTHRDQIAEFTYGFMQNLKPVQDLLVNPDNFNEQFLGFVDLTTHAIGANGVNIFLILLAVIAAYTQYVISKQTSPTTTTKRLRDVLSEAGEGKQPDQAELNAVMMSKMVKFLPFMMFFIMMSLPGALVLYYVVSNIFAAVQQHFLLKRDAEEMDKMADEPAKGTGKKATAKARAKIAAEAKVTENKGPNITRIKAKDTSSRKSNS
jgi:YidC/Oxa1 family membrane protein insertase